MIFPPISGAIAIDLQRHSATSALLSSISCKGHEDVLLNCSYQFVQGDLSCPNAGVVCQGNIHIFPQIGVDYTLHYFHPDPSVTFVADCIDGDIRLTNGSNVLEGRVEICFNKAWGTVCDVGFGDDEAQVICNHLTNKMGYIHNTSIPLRDAMFGEGRGPIFIESLGCTGTESELVGTSGCHLGSPVGIHTCEHSQDAGVICTGKQLALVSQQLLLKCGILLPSYVFHPRYR